MPNQDINLAAMLGARMPMQVQQVPTKEQRDEVEKVRGMQVRTEAAKIAGALLSGKSPKATEFIQQCRVVELYITDGDDFGDSAPPLLSR
jgi:hypothetical protein